MFANRFTVLLDANVLVPALTRNLILSLAFADLFRARWSARILDETEAAIAKLLTSKGAPDPDLRATRARHAIEGEFPASMVEGYEHHEVGLSELPDPDDAHVIAAAIDVDASIIVTNNLDDFPTDVLLPLKIEAKTADAFLSDAIDLDKVLAAQTIADMRQRLTRPPLSPDHLLLRMEKNGLTQTANLIAPMREII